MYSEIDPIAVGRVAAAAHRGEVDIVHLHTPHAHTVGLLAARLLGSAASRPRVVVARRVTFPMRRHPLQAFKYGAGVDAFVAASFAVRARLLRHGVEPSRVAVIHDGIEPPAPDPASVRELEGELRLAGLSPRIGHVGHFETHKGQRFLLQAFARLLPRRPQAVLVLVGDGPLRAALEEQARALKVQDRVRFAGLREEVAPAIALFDLFAMPSIQEGLGSVILDAMALGKPVCASAAGGIPEIIRDGENGVLVRAQDPVALAEGLERLLADPEGALRMAEAGRRSVAERFSSAGMVEQTLRLYRLAVAGERSHPCASVQPAEPPPRRRLTVLHLNTERGWRGGENQTLQLVRGLRGRGHTALLACQKGGRLEERARSEGVPCEALSMRGDLDLLAAFRLRRLFSESSPDVVHYHTSHAASLGTLAGLCGQAPPAVLTKRTSFPLGGSPLSLAKYTWRVQQVVAVSAQVRDLLVREGVPSERVSVVHSGVELERFRSLGRSGDLRARLGWTEEQFVLGNVAHLAAHKGHAVLIEALARLRRRLPPARLLLVGDGEERAALEARAQALGQAEAIHFAGFQSDVAPWIAAMDLFVLPSLSGEGSPGAVKEAMAAGVPVLCSDVQGIREIIRDGDNGRIVPLDDPEALARAALDLALSPAARAALAERGRADSERYSMDGMVEAMERIYFRMLEPGESNPPQGAAESALP
jgi:glycosyltransferase involved in cell wall biosynthesis